MVNKNQTTKINSLDSYGIYNANVNYQLTAEQLQKDTILKGQGKLANSGALAVNTGEFTGRSPMDRFIVKDEITKDKIQTSRQECICAKNEAACHHRPGYKDQVNGDWTEKPRSLPVSVAAPALVHEKPAGVEQRV